MKRTMIIATLSSLLLLISLSAAAQIRTTVYDIMEDSWRKNEHILNGEYVRIKGTVTQYEPRSSRTTTAHYILKDDDGATIKVISTESPPTTYRKYWVWGVLSWDENFNEIVIYENRRRVILNTGEWAMILGGVLVIILLVVLIIQLTGDRQKKGPKVVPRPPTPVPPQPEPKPHPQPKPPYPHPGPKPRQHLENETIIVSQEYYTMKAMPGSLVIQSGPESGKSLKLFGTPTAEGEALTIGRDSPDWKNHVKRGRESAHLRIKDTSRTMSRMQAELIYKDGKMYLRNLGTKNTTKVDGIPVETGQMLELNNGSVIETGYLRFQYNA